MPLLNHRASSPHRRASFTLIELLVVLAIVAILSVVVIMTLNPSELLKQARDSNRLSDLSTLNTALAAYSADMSQGFMGTSSIVYVSIPDTSPTCDNLGLPILPTGWSYNCVTEANLKKSDGRGWMPVNFSQISFGSPLSSLPVDPVNTTSSGNYYTYVTDTSKYNLALSVESQKYGLGGSLDVVSKDGGTYAGLYEKGTSLSLVPIDYGLAAYLPSGIWGLWEMSEGGGQYISDSSGNGRSMMFGIAPTSDAADPTWDFVDGVRTLTFAGTQQASTTIPTLPQPFSIVILVKPTDTSVARIILSNGSIAYGINRNGTATPAYYMRFSSYGPYTQFGVGAWSLMQGVLNSTNSKVRSNNGGWATGDSGANGFPTQIVLGAPASGNQGWVGQIAFLAIYPRALTDSEFNSIYSAVKTIKSAALP